MTPFIRLGAAVALVLFPALAFAEGEGPGGTWRDSENSLIKIYDCGAGLCAQIAKAKFPDQRDENNPDAGKRNQKLQGLVIMNGAQKVGSSEWRGKLYNPKDGSTYDGKVILINNQQLKLQGCAMGGLFCQGETLSRIGN